ncbi:Svx/AvrXca family virulence/avirulence protein [Sphingopyxis sp.]|uniref:Svx/AvrXca family virulence/avirulence protein n=1 Tax=Sphingopyxis sp. TaxID=1908224 RepID=UPI002FC7B9FB
MADIRAIQALWLFALAGCSGGPGVGPVTPPASNPAAPSARAGETMCIAGAWSVAVTDPNDKVNGALPVRYETTHFAFRWQGDLVPMADARTAGEHLEFVWGEFIDRIGFPEPDCRDTEKRKANIYVAADYGLSGGADELGQMGMWIGPGGVRDRFGLAHEFAHALQAKTGAYRASPYSQWLWESHANWMALQLPEFRSNTHCSVLSVNYPHLYYGSSRVRYCNWQFLEYIKNRFGYPAVNALWSDAPKDMDAEGTSADPIAVLMRSRGWTLAQLNDAFGDWAMRNASWDYVNPDGTDQGAVYRREYGGYEAQAGDRLRRTTILDPIDLDRRRFAVPAAWAPQRWGYNIVRLHPDADASSVTVTFRGVTQDASATAALPGLANEPAAIPPPSSGWRWGIVAVGGSGRARYSPLERGADGQATLPLLHGDQGLYLIVMGAPDSFHHIGAEQPYYSIYRYPWMAAFEGALPEGFQPGASAPASGGHRHPNGGGWVAAGATVDPTAYVGPWARVLSGSVRDHARVEDHAVVDGGQLLGNARVSGLSVIRGNTIVKERARVDTAFVGLGEFERDIVLSGTAQNVGDVEQRGASFTKGVYYGFVDQAAADDPARGARLAASVAEITAKPVYIWRP